MRATYRRGIMALTIAQFVVAASLGAAGHLDRAAACGLAWLALIVLVVMHATGRLLLAPQQPLDEPIQAHPERAIALTENWGGGRGRAAIAVGLTLVGFVAAAVGAGWSATVSILLSAILVAVAGRIIAEQFHRPDELRIEAHKLEVWRLSLYDGKPRRRLRIRLHEVERVEVIEDREHSVSLPSRTMCRRLCITDVRGERVELKLPMKVRAADRFVKQLRELIVQARSVEPDQDALNQLRSMGRRAQHEGTPTANPEVQR